MKDKTNLKLVITALVSIIVSSSITAFAAIKFQANEIGYNTTSVADALDSLYQTQFSNNYSTEEKVVGKWIDGKPVYQKTLYFTDLYGGEHKYTNPIQNVDKIWYNSDASFIYDTSENAYWKLGSSNGNDYGFRPVWSSDSQLSLWINSVLANRSSYMYLTVLYTKTTDQPISN